MLEEVRQSHPVDPNVLGRLGEAYLASGNTAEAETAFQQLNEAEPGNPDNVMRLADLRIAQSKFDAALEQLTPLVDKQVADNEGGKAAELLQKVLAKRAVSRQDAPQAGRSSYDPQTRLGSFDRLRRLVRGVQPLWRRREGRSSG